MPAPSAMLWTFGAGLSLANSGSDRSQRLKVTVSSSMPWIDRKLYVGKLPEYRPNSLKTIMHFGPFSLL
jgi:hypothetical protein